MSGLFAYFCIGSVVNEVVYYRHVSMSSGVGRERDCSSNWRGKDCVGLYVCVGRRRRCSGGDVFDEKQTVLDFFKMVKDSVERVIVKVRPIF
jgi:hypothetical protein